MGARHYQLRHFISCPTADRLYYANKNDVYYFNAKTKRRTKIATLEFEARCTASGYGFVCVGGENKGLFAIIKVDQFRRSNNSEVDASLPLNLENRRTRRTSLGELTPLLRVERLGEDIVNSISIHKLFGNDESVADDVVAVLTNNDKTVRIYSLTQDREITKLEFPFPMNHATISPDGHTLVAVGDYHQCFFYERVKKTPRGSPIKTNETNYVTTVSEWCELAVVRLHVPPNVSTTWYFTTAWSTLGDLCAVGSECGYISVFDVHELLNNECAEDALIHVVRSTRPAATYGAGAVRTMCFSPPPWDLLIWSEDHGRACILDLRSRLSARQVLTLDPKDESVERVEVTTSSDLDLSDLRHDHYYMGRMGPPADPSTFSFGGEYNEPPAERRRPQRYSTTTGSEDDSHEFNAREIMEALMTARRREQDLERSGHDIIPRSIGHNDPGSTETDSRANLGAANDIYLRDRGLVETSLPSIQTLENYLLGHPQSLLLERSSLMPRRQASVVVPDEARSASPSNSSLARLTSIPPHARRAWNNAPSLNSDGWSLIEAAMANETARAANTLSTSSRTASATNAADSRRLRQINRPRERRNLQSLGAEDNITRYYGRAADNTPDWGLKTAGVAMSEDGRVLYVGTVDGIFEYKINVHARRIFPAVTPR